MRGGCQVTDEGEECQHKKVWKAANVKERESPQQRQNRQ